MKSALEFPGIERGDLHEAKKSMPSKGYIKKYQDLPYWNQGLERLKRCVRAIRKSYQAAIHPDQRRRRLAKYRILKSNYQKKIEEATAKSWENLVRKSIGLNPWGVPYKLVSKK